MKMSLKIYSKTSWKLFDRNFSLQFEADEMETSQGRLWYPLYLLIGQGWRQKILPLRNLGKERLMKQKITLLTYLALPIHLSVWTWTTKILQAMHRLIIAMQVYTYSLIF
jgi:hypothetical protein